MCNVCGFKAKNEPNIKRHMRDKHDIVSVSTSPPPKKTKVEGEVIIGVIAAIFVNDVLHFSRGQVVHTPLIGSCMSTKTNKDFVKGKTKR